MSRPLANEVAAVCREIPGAARLLLALDFDGTLAPIAAHPGQAAMPPATAEALRRLAASRRASVAVISGRSIADLKRRLHLDVIHAGNHGLEMEGRGISFLHRRAEVLRGALAGACRDIEESLRGVPSVFLERKGLTATVHYRQVPESLHVWLETAVRYTLRPYAPLLSLWRARKAWELRPRVRWNKGLALNYLWQKTGQPEVVVCAGDDTTDEDMFARFPDAISIKVGTAGSAPTKARYHVSGPEELSGFLFALLSTLTLDDKRLISSGR